MTKTKCSILESWPALKEDLISFLTDTDAWIITELKKAQRTGNWKEVSKVIDLMESVHMLSHPH